MSALGILAVIFIAITIAAVPVRILTGHLAWAMLERDNEKYNYANTRPSGEMWFGCTLLATLAVLVFPVSIVWFITGRKVKAGAEYRNQRKVDQARIAELEKELKIANGHH